VIARGGEVSVTDRYLIAADGARSREIIAALPTNVSAV
jgi:hypothetical protein